MTEIDETMKIRKAIAPMVKGMIEEVVKEVTDPLVKLIKEDRDAVQVNVAVSTEQLEKIIEEKLEAITKAVVVELPEPKVIVNNPEKHVVTGEVTVKDLKKVEEKLDNIGKMEKRITENLAEHIEKTAFVIAKSIMDHQKKIREMQYEEGEALPVKVMNQMVAEGGGGSTGRNTDDRVWLRERTTWITVSGEFVPSRIEKWSNTHKLTENYEYDGNANPVIKSRAMEALTAIGE